MDALLDRLRQAGPAENWSALPPEAASRLERLAGASSLYARLLEQHPAWALWLETPQNLHEEFRFQALLDEWTAFHAAHGAPARDATGYPALLRRFRRKMSLRIAYRDVNELAAGPVTVGELTRLAEFCVRECLFIALAQWTRRLGEPWDETLDRRARFCVLGLGKLGGGELNFCSDVDLIYLYEGEGQTRRDGQPTATTNGEFFHRVGETVTQLLTQNDADGFMFRADLRLRPGGAAALLVPSLDAVENYYAATAQTWERLALLKARPIAGDLALGAELLENLHSFRYPRHPPPALLTEVAAMKQRTEREVVGAEALARNVKSGFGGIREIEFVAQVLQLLHAGRFPFLQTHSTIEALRQLVRYDLLDGAVATFLTEAYWFLRQVEHRVQLEAERQTHELPEAPAERARLARSLGFAGGAEFDEKLAAIRTRVRRHYAELFRDAESAAVDAADPWWSFFADETAPAPVRARLESWFGAAAAGDADTWRTLRLFVRGSDAQPLLREHVQRFVALAPALDRVAPRLARPRATLQRIATFGERYGSRSQFLAACIENPHFFDVLALLFDRSRFIHDLLSRHPEIFEEVLRPEILRKAKDVAARCHEIAQHPGAPAAEFAAWLWLYVRAEQVRAAIGHLLGFIDDAAAEAELTGLADAVLHDAQRRVLGADELLCVALGKAGGAEFSFGSDLDLVFLGPDGDNTAREPVVRAIIQRLGGGAGRDPTFAIDLRLRPHGDAGPLVPGLADFRRYFAGSAQTWERQVLTRARVVGGPADRAAAWDAFVAETAFARGLSEAEAAELWQMRLRIQHERDVVQPRERAFKTAAGGLVDIEFSLQILQLRHGAAHPAIRTPNTAAGWAALGAAGLADPADVALVLDHHRHLKRLEWALRRDENRAVTVMPERPEDQEALARWLGAESRAAFWSDHVRRLTETRGAVRRVLAGTVPSTTLETDR